MKNGQKGSPWLMYVGVELRFALIWDSITGESFASKDNPPVRLWWWVEIPFVIPLKWLWWKNGAKNAQTVIHYYYSNDCITWRGKFITCRCKKGWRVTWWWQHRQRCRGPILGRIWIKSRKNGENESLPENTNGYRARLPESTSLAHFSQSLRSNSGSVPRLSLILNGFKGKSCRQSLYSFPLNMVYKLFLNI